MVVSLVLAWIATIVQTLPRIGLTFDEWPIIVVLQLPWLIGVLIMRRLMQRYGVTQARPPKG